MNKVTPKDFFLWAGAMVSLYGGVVALITLLFQYINYAYPDMLTNAYFDADPYNGAIRFAMSALIVLTPIFLVLMRLIRNSIAADPTRADIWVRRWFLYLTLFVAGATMAIDLIVLVNYFLNGDVTMRFVLKVLVVLLVAGAGFLHFLADLRGYWTANRSRANLVGYGALLVVVVSIVGGFFIIGTPNSARLARFDEQKVNDLSNIQYQVVYYYQQKEKLPQNLAELTDPISGYVAPKDAQTGQDYGYRVTGPLSFEVCATFNAPTRGADRTYADPSLGRTAGGETWAHGAGQTCFTRTIDPERYPPTEKPVPARI
jgi:hypothetical protein